MKFKKWRKSMSLTQQDAAEDLGVSYQAIAKLEERGLKGAKRIKQIEDYTEGQVQLEDWL